MPEETSGTTAAAADDADAVGGGEAGSGAPSRRSVLGWGGAGLALGAAAAGGTVAALTSTHDAVPAALTGAAVPFHGKYQAGIASAVQDRLHFAAFDVKTKDRAELVQLLKEWTRAAERMTAGLPVGEGAVGGLPEAPPDDTGEALGLKPSRLTLTIGFGASLFAKGRFGLEDKRPEALIDLELFPGDNLDAARSGGDICVQACADDPQVAVHAIRQLARIGFGKTAVRWSQLGFGKTSSTTPEEQTPRNMMGFKDGTRNISGTDTAALEKHVWVSAKDAPGASSWLVDGSYLVARRIRMNIEIWDRTPLQEQEDIFGRDKAEGAPVGKSKERDEPFLKAMKPEAHVRLAHPDTNDGATILRRGYSFTDGTDGLGRLDAGLFFLAYQRDVRKGFVPIQRSLAKSDVLNEYIQHVGSAVFAVPPGVRDKDDWWGRALFS
ncbi:iron uptake transporter deferrochelatase/peroxidase subunit [Streptomyces sp. APSN-46.1]|uniref:iron uptake transporter deferrochelatase/peroxidase subunit n=1 Tax=Streptomyces sp. APSN-46.1 TaxID=2929049 RepID=UPI001FB4321C|nr:iron uptake transporter deferrochelatase/peroxidase subunit [Streptomyces sp. APSN-46.1]MCJ1677598.1 iron uptake transporter deferrochelatase/peroxidase subunit [Streptomyces sp. APSN-46.1]